MKFLIVLLALIQISFGMDSSIESAIRCIEKKQMDVFSVERINGKIYVEGKNVASNLAEDNFDLKFDAYTSIFELKRDCFLEKIESLNDGIKKGLLKATLDRSQDSIIVSDDDSVLWSCPVDENLAFFEILNKKILIINDNQTVWLLNDKCQKTIFETNSQLTVPHNAAVQSRFFSYYFHKRKKSYIVLFDSSFSNYWGKSTSFQVEASAQNIACGHDFYENYDDTSQNQWFVKCIEWTGNDFVEKTLSYKVKISSGLYPVAERLFPCGDGICVQDFKSKKIEILVDE